MEDLVKSGILFTPCQGLLKLKQKKTWVKKYFALYKKSRSGIERLEIFESEEAFIKQNNASVKIIALNECHKVTAAPQKHQSNVFEIRTKESVHLLSADTFQEMTDWLNCLQLVAFGLNNNLTGLGTLTTTTSSPASIQLGSTSSFPNSTLNYSIGKETVHVGNLNALSNANHSATPNISNLNNNNNNNNNNNSTNNNNNHMSSNNLNGSTNQCTSGSSSLSSSSVVKRVVQEENLLYSSVDAPEIYRVRIIESEATLRCDLQSKNTWYYLILTSVSISLAEELSHQQTGRILYVWPYRHIRRYGTIKEGFSFEAGRKCRSGDGLFTFHTKEGNEIFQSVGGHVNSLKSAGLENNAGSDWRGYNRDSSTSTNKRSSTEINCDILKEFHDQHHHNNSHHHHHHHPHPHHQNNFNHNQQKQLQQHVCMLSGEIVSNKPLLPLSVNNNITSPKRVNSNSSNQASGQEPIKRHSIQLSKSPFSSGSQHPVTKAPITRSKTVDDARVLRALPAIVSLSDSSCCSSDLEDMKGGGSTLSSSSKPFPPISKPPRKSKTMPVSPTLEAPSHPPPPLPPVSSSPSSSSSSSSSTSSPTTINSKDSDPDPLYEDPIFVSREELMLIMTKERQVSGEEGQQKQGSKETHKSSSGLESDQETGTPTAETNVGAQNANSQGLTNQNNNIINNNQTSGGGQTNSTSGNPMTKLTSAIRSMFANSFGSNQKKLNKVKAKAKKSNSSTSSRSNSSRSSVSPSDNSSCPQTPSIESERPQKGVSEVDSKISPLMTREEVSNKVVSVSTSEKKGQSIEIPLRPKSVPNPLENNYENIPPLVPAMSVLTTPGKTVSIATDNPLSEIQPEHYLQNEVEYAMVVKRIGGEVLRTDI